MACKKELLIDAVIGAGVPREMIRGEYAPLVTLAWGEHRTWKQPPLHEMTEEELHALYSKIKELRCQ